VGLGIAALTLSARFWGVVLRQLKDGGPLARA
jgi:hypothetical protein